MLVPSTIPSINTWLKKNILKRNGQTQYKILKMLYKCIMANTSAIRHQAAYTTYQLSSPSCSTRAIQKSITHNYLSFQGEKKSGEWTISRKMTRQKEQEDQAEKTIEEIGKGNQMTALRFQTGDDIRHPWPFLLGWWVGVQQFRRHRK